MDHGVPTKGPPGARSGNGSTSITSSRRATVGGALCPSSAKQRGKWKCKLPVLAEIFAAKLVEFVPDHVKHIRCLICREGSHPRRPGSDPPPVIRPDDKLPANHAHTRAKLLR